MKKKKNMGIRILCALILLGICGSVMFAIYSLSAEDGQMSSTRSETVTKKIKEQANTKPETTEEGIVLGECIEYFVILHPPYGSDWNTNIRKLAYLPIYFTLAAGTYITLVILGVNKFWRSLFIVGICFCFTFGGEYHRKSTSRILSMSDMYPDTFGALVSTYTWMVISIIYSGIHLLVNKACGDTQFLQY